MSSSDTTIISADSSKLLPNLKEFSNYRQLLYSLAWRDIKVKYAQTYIGILWVVINPILNLAVLSFVFGVIVKVDTEGIPHILFTLTGLTAWTYFATLLSEAGNSIIGAQSMIKKIYFPRLIIPLSKALSGLVDFGVTLLCLICLMIYLGHPPGPNIVWLPLFLLLAILSGLAGGILVSALSARYRDFSYVVPLMVRLGLYATPIAYSASLVPEKYKALYYLNPMAGIVEGFRWSLLGSGAPNPYMLYSAFFMIVIFVVSILYFTRIERDLADIL